MRATANTSELFACSVGYFNGHPATAPRISYMAREAAGNVATWASWSNGWRRFLRPSILIRTSPSSTKRAAPYSNDNMNCDSIEVIDASHLSPKRE